MAREKKAAAAGVEQGFLQSIRETPADDAPRLVYADWLEDNGDPERAEFIRAQIRLAGMDPFDHERGELLFREHRLLRAHGKKWSKEARKFTTRAEFSRGFVGSMALPVPKFLDNAESIFAAVPLTELRPLQMKPRWAELLASPYLARLRSLDLHFSQIGMARTAAVADCIHLENLEELNLGIAQPRAGGLAALLDSPHLRNLRKLDLNKDDFDDECCARLAARGGHFPRLRQLNLAGNGITATGAARLAEAGWLRQLERLDLSSNSIGDEGARRLAESGVWSNVRHLELRYTDLTLEGVRAVVHCPHLGRVTDLRLPTLRLPGALGELVRSAHLGKLRVLDLRNGEVKEDEIDALIDSPLAARLRCVRLSGLTGYGLRRVLTAPSLSGLVELALSGHDGAHGRPGGFALAELLHEAGHLNHLDRLDLSCCRFGDQGMALLADTQHLASLGELDVTGNNITAQGHEPLLRSPHFARLRKLHAAEAYMIGPEARQRVVDHFGKDVCG